MNSHDKENVIFGSILGAVANVIAALLLYFGGTKPVMWMCIVGIACYAIGILCVFADRFNGCCHLVAGILGIVLAHFFGKKLFSGAAVSFLANLFSDALPMGICYFARLCFCGVLASVIMLLINLVSALHKD